MEYNIIQVDAFTDESFGGNPAGVLVESRGLSSEYMQKIANEMSLSETAFIDKMSDDEFNVRFFTPTDEVDLCGHATIGSFFVLAKNKYIKGIENGTKRVYQKTKAGKLFVDIVYEEGEVAKVYMEQSVPQDLGLVKDLDKLCKSLSIKREDLAYLDIGIEARKISTGLLDIIVGVKSKEILDKIVIDRELLKEVSEENGVIGAHVFHLASRDSEFVYTRNFAPLVGIDEEAATGTSNGALIYYLTSNDLIDGKEIIAKQGESMNRLSEIYCSIDDDNLVKVGGRAKIIIDGILKL